MGSFNVQLLVLDPYSIGYTWSGGQRKGHIAACECCGTRIPKGHEGVSKEPHCWRGKLVLGLGVKGLHWAMGWGAVWSSWKIPGTFVWYLHVYLPRTQ